MTNPEDPELTINVELLEQLAVQVEAEPTAFDMNSWANRLWPGVAPEPNLPHPCFTTACIAGWAVFLGHGSLKGFADGNIGNEAQRLLGVTREQSLRLFHVGDYESEVDDMADYDDSDEASDEENEYSRTHWPRQFSDQYIDFPHSQAEHISNAAIAAARIRHFIATEGEE